MSEKEKTEFSLYHPVVNMLYFVLTIGITMFSLSPIFLAATFIVGWIYSVYLGGEGAIKMNLIFTGSTLAVMAIINTLFTHNGATILFYINTNRVTLEAFIYGISAAIMLVSVIIWFSAFNKIISADKLIFLFGKIAPVIGLTLSMIFRFIPLLKSRFKEISMGQKCMGCQDEKGIINKIRQLTKEVSILIAWSLEASIESADSMEARGYGLHGRTSFHLFKFTGRDKVLTGILVGLGAVVLYGLSKGKGTVYFYPTYVFNQPDILTLLTLAAYIILLGLPIIIDIRGEQKWKTLN